MTACDRIFAAVFPPPSEASLPTPKATPVLGSGGFEGSEVQSAIDWDPQDSAAEVIVWERAWHTATAFLSLPNQEFPKDRNCLQGTWWKECTPEVSAAIKYLVAPDSQGAQIRRYQPESDLLHWYFEEAGLRHFIQYVRPLILQVISIQPSPFLAPDDLIKDRGCKGLISPMAWPILSAASSEHIASTCTTWRITFTLYVTTTVKSKETVSCSI